MSEERGIDAEKELRRGLSRNGIGCVPEVTVDVLAALFASGGIEGDGDLVLRRRGDEVRVVGRLDGPLGIDFCAEHGGVLNEDSTYCDVSLYSSVGLTECDERGDALYRIMEAPDAG